MSKDSPPLPAAFGYWQFETTSDKPGGSFEAASTTDETVPVWRSEFPADPVAAAAALTENENQTQGSIIALNSVPDRIDTLLLQVQLADPAGVSFDITSMPEPEAELLDLVQTINMPATGVSFVVGGEDQNKIEEAFAQFDSDMKRLLRLVTHFAWVETEVEGVLLGRSVVSWTGDLDTNWATGLKADIYQLHKRSLIQALATRNIALHAITITAQSAVKLSVLLATPGGAILALPLAWKFVKQILADIQKYKEITKIPS